MSPSQGKRLGEGLLLDAIQRRLDLSNNPDAYAVEVNAIDESEVAFYAEYALAPLLDNLQQLLLPLAAFAVSRSADVVYICLG